MHKYVCITTVSFLFSGLTFQQNFNDAQKYTKDKKQIRRCLYLINNRKTGCCLFQHKIGKPQGSIVKTVETTKKSSNKCFDTNFFLIGIEDTR